MIEAVLLSNATVSDAYTIPHDEECLLNVLDVLSYAKHQLGSANQIIANLKEVETLAKTIPSEVKVNLIKSGKDKLKMEGNALCLELGLESTSRPFITSS